MSSPPRNLFTGKTPEAFSYSYGQGTNQEQVSSLVAAASNNIPVKTVDFTKDQSQSKSNNGPISPQVTFLASQGAHLPSINTQQQQQSISRMFMNAEKPSMPQLMNYEAATKETEQENNKSLWRWQYGLNANNESPTKSSISRSFAEGDDVMINFSDMTQDQYTNMIRSQVGANEERSQEIEEPRFVQVNPFERKPVNNIYNHNQQKPNHQVTYPDSHVNFPPSNWYNQNFNDHAAFEPRNVKQQIENRQLYASTSHPNIIALTESYTDQVHLAPKSNASNDSQVNEWPSKQPKENNKEYQENDRVQSTEYADTLTVEESRYIPDSRANLVTSKHVTPASEAVTQSYDYDENFFEVRKLKSYKDKNVMVTNIPIYNTPSTQIEKSVNTSSNKYAAWQNNENYEHEFNNKNDWSQNKISESSVITTSELPAFTSNTLKFSDFISNGEENSSDFKPLFSTEKIEKETTSTTETNIEDMFNNNIFLKNLFRGDKPVSMHQNAILEDPKKQYSKPGPHPEQNIEKKPKHIIHQNPFNELKVIKQKPLDMSDLLNYVSMKNHFESGKVKVKKQNGFHENQRNEVHYPNIDNDQNEKSNDNNRLRTQQHEELGGIIKNYKVLRRNNNVNMNVHHNSQPNKEVNLVPYRMIQVPNMPLLGRAGPAAKSYLPPIYA